MAIISEEYRILLEKEKQLAQYKTRMSHFLEEENISQALNAKNEPDGDFKRRMIGTAGHIYKEYAILHERYETLLETSIQMERKATTLPLKTTSKLLVTIFFHEVRRTGHEMRVAKDIEDTLSGLDQVINEVEREDQDK